MIFLLWEHCNFPEKYENLTLKNKNKKIYIFRFKSINWITSKKSNLYLEGKKFTVIHRSNESFHCRGTLVHKGKNTEPINVMQKFSSRKKKSDRVQLQILFEMQRFPGSVCRLHTEMKINKLTHLEMRCRLIDFFFTLIY